MGLQKRHVRFAPLIVTSAEIKDDPRILWELNPKEGYNRIYLL